MIQWKCSGCGACCRLFSKHVLGYQCHMLDQDNKCKCYRTRHKSCRVDLLDFRGRDRNEYMNARCAMIRHLEHWVAEVGHSESVDYILERISKSGLG